MQSDSDLAGTSAKPDASRKPAGDADDLRAATFGLPPDPLTNEGSRLSATLSARNGNGDGFVTVLNRSQLCTEFREAFTEVTGLPLALQPFGSWQLPHHGSKHENPFCALMAERSRTCVACLQSHERLWEGAMFGEKTMACAYGFCETAVPVRLGAEVIGFLHTGQAFRRQPTPAQFERVQRLIAQAAPDLELKEAKARWFNAPVLGARRWTAMAALLRIFAEHLSLVSRQLAMQARHAEPPAITRAREFIEANYCERLSLSVVARVVHTSPFYFCKLFKRVTGTNFTDYLSRIRVEKAKNLLLNPNLRISEIAFEVGFQSLTHFNRIFKRLTGQAPSEYRRQMPGA